jgi:hypothetical protein
MSMESHIVSGRTTLCGLDATGNEPERLGQKLLGLRCRTCAGLANRDSEREPSGLFLGLF